MVSHVGEKRSRGKCDFSSDVTADCRGSGVNGGVASCRFRALLRRPFQVTPLAFLSIRLTKEHAHESKLMSAFKQFRSNKECTVQGADTIASGRQNLIRRPVAREAPAVRHRRQRGLRASLELISGKRSVSIAHNVARFTALEFNSPPSRLRRILAEPCQGGRFSTTPHCPSAGAVDVPSYAAAPA